MLLSWLNGIKPLGGRLGEEGRYERPFKQGRLAMSWPCLCLLAMLPAPGFAQDGDSAGADAEKYDATTRLPRVVAVLPFENLTAEPGLAEETRRAFYNHFSSKPYTDIEMSAVDEQLLAQARPGGAALDMAALCRELGCDAVVTGRVTDFRKLYAGVYSEMAIVAEVSLVDARSGETLIRHADQVTYREGGVSLNPVGLVMTAISTALNLRDIQRMRLISELGHKIAGGLPEPATGAQRTGPKIVEVLSNSADTPLGLGKVLRVAMQGDRGGHAAFDIGNYRRGNAMREQPPGIYVGEYRIQEGDSVRQAPVVATLRARNGLESRWHDIALVTLDSVLPATPTGLAARSLPGKVMLRWDELTATADLAAYKILRSEQPLSGYTPIGSVETNSFTDALAAGALPRYYRVVAVDRAGNESDPGGVVRGRGLSSEMQALAGRIESDRELAGNVLVTGDVVVPPGVTLSLAPGTVMTFNAGAGLSVEGGLMADAADDPVEFVAKDKSPWKGIAVAGGNIGLRGFAISGADTCLDLDRAHGGISLGQIRQCGTAIVAQGGTPISLSQLRISENRTGIRLLRGDASLTRSKLTHNGLGVEMAGFVGIMRDNAILQNEVNLRAEPGTLLEANYWGSLDPEAMRIEGARISEALNRHPPEGQPVAVRANPYLHLSPEARQTQATEALAEAARLFRAKNYGRALSYFEQAIAARPAADSYYFAALCHQEMGEEDKAIERLREGIAAFPSDPSLHRALGMLHYQRGEEALARVRLTEALRLAPGDRQAAFVLDRIGAPKPPTIAQGVRP
jgi:hypothetical protein